MKNVIITIALTLAAAFAHADSQTLADQCNANAGAFNQDEKIACIQVTMESSGLAAKTPHPVVSLVESCKAVAGAFNQDEKQGCIAAVVTQHTSYCEQSAMSHAMVVERAACIRNVEDARNEVTHL